MSGKKANDGSILGDEGLPPLIHALRLPLLIGLVGATLSVSALLVAREFDEARVDRVLDFRAQWRASDFRSKIAASLVTVDNLAAFISASHPISGGDFNRYTRRVSRDTPIRSLSWAPRVWDIVRNEFEVDARLGGIPNFEIRERDAEDNLVRATARQEYYPIWLSERFENQPDITGLDLSSVGSISSRIAVARDGGRPVAAALTTLMTPALSRPLYQVIWPVFRSGAAPDDIGQRNLMLEGVVLGIFRIEALLDAAIVGSPPILETIHFYVDAPATGDADFLPVAIYQPERGFTVPLNTPIADTDQITENFEILGHRWTLVSVFPAAYRQSLRSPAPWVLFAAGIMLTGLICFYIVRQDSLRQAIEQTVADRTSDLVRTNAALEDQIIERKRVETALQHQAETLAATLATLPVGIVHFDPDRGILFWSRMAEKIFGISALDMLGKQLHLVADDDKAVFDKLLDEIIEGSVVHDFMLQMRHNDGRLLDISFSSAALYDGDELRGVIGIMEDVTQRRALEAQLMQSQKMEALGQLTGGMAHDFNNLLMVITGNLQLVQDLAEDRSDILEFATDAYRAAERGADLIRSLLAFARRQPLRPRQVDIADIVGNTVKMLQRILGENIKVDFSPGTALWPVNIDPVQLESALTNLATNARDAMPKGGRLAIAIKNRRLDGDYVAQQPDAVTGDYVMLQVSDTGDGIPPDIMQHIFEPFFTTKERSRGTGLGLSMIFGFMKQSGGHINVYSEVGVGTTFRLYLPRYIDPSIPLETAAQSAIASGNELILVVEDDAAIRKLVVREIAALGYKVIEADSAARALTILEAGQQIDLVFTDVVMAGKLDGLDLARMIPRRWPGVKVMLTSGFPDTKVGDELEELENIRLISKPYRRAELAAKLRAALDDSVDPGDD